MPFRQAPVGLFSPLTAAEIVELNTVINPPVPFPPYAPLRVQVAPDNLGQAGKVTTPDEILVIAGWDGPGYAGVPGNPVPPGSWWVPTAYAVNKSLRLLCERVNSLCPRPANGVNDIPYCAFIGAELWLPPPGTYPAQTIRDPATWDVLTQSVYNTSGLFMAVQGGMLNGLFRVTDRMLHSHETARSRTLAAQASHIFMQVIDDRFGPGYRHHTLIVISPKRKTIDYLDDYNGLQSTRPDLVPPLPRHYIAEQKLIGHILNFLSSYIGSTSISGNEFNPKHWMMRTNASAQSPIPGPAAVIDAQISAAMVCYNALMIAMGYRLDFFRHIPAGMTQAQMIANRRGQIALELHRGQLAVAPSRQYIAPMWPEQSDNFRYTSGSTPFKNLIAKHCNYGVVEELSRRDRARWYRGVPPKIDFDIGRRITKPNLILYGLARGIPIHRMRYVSWGPLRNIVEKFDYMARRQANGNLAVNPPSY
ncbi:uncharacterized protein EAF01_005879 [Botrytis porri]|uniref:Uncharacterized protein n=1 Tax=Botrytis porri TaxID=87229 RepID=A0A4Z1KKI0_9HELO|nr:uncharacterized protein EAF01_005879 [Botrytis porri]KAF7905358.1 hypothetical protein EAF01_005879 [Botrytis porri]TGO86573.1 hypothetical protein BPOR_0292g00020 [Botrytis porri]